MFQIINDDYRKILGGWSQILEISCNECQNFLFFYQKDGPGDLKRCFLDRIQKIHVKPENFYCPYCNKLLGNFIPYVKHDNRPAIQWLNDLLSYRIVFDDRN